MSSPHSPLLRAAGLFLLAGAFGAAELRVNRPHAPPDPWDVRARPLPVFDDFEAGSPRAPLLTIEADPFLGRRAVRFEARGFFTERASLPLVDLRGARDPRLVFAWRVPRLDAGSVRVVCTLFGPSLVEHPAVPRAPARISKRLLLEVKAPASEWGRFEARLADVFPDSLLERAVAARLELRWKGIPEQGIRPDGVLDLDAVRWEDGRADP